MKTWKKGIIWCVVLLAAIVFADQFMAILVAIGNVAKTINSWFSR